MSNIAARVSTDALKRFTTDVFSRAGLSAEHSKIVTEVLVWANLRGADTHGVTRVPQYVDMIDVGDMNPRPAIAVRNVAPASVVIEADRAAGPVAMTIATSCAVQKASNFGIGMALVRMTTHTAALGYYTLMAAREGMAAIAFSASRPNMVYHGARAAGVSTSPISIAVPGGDFGPVLLDMATGVVSVGKLMQARKNAEAISPGWALDKQGRPTTDPTAAHIPLPMAGPKGSGLALMIECITSLIVSTPLLSDYLENAPEGRRHKQNGLIIAIDVAKFVELSTFRHEVDRLVAAIKALPPDSEAGEILLPGERGSRTFDERSRDGIPVARVTLEELRRLGERLGVSIFPLVGE